MATQTSVRVPARPPRLWKPAAGLRRSEAQRHALKAVVRQIRTCDPNSRRKYLREFNEAFRSYESVLSRADFDSLIVSAGVVLLGDYHALAASQKFAAEVIEHSKNSGRRLVLGLEMVFARDQHIVDEWTAGEISDDELRERIRFDVDWGYEWPPYLELLKTARDAGARICGLDCMPRGDLRRIGARDRHAATKIAELRAADPEALIVVLFGESHLAPTHLPQEIHSSIPGERVLTVLQNIDALYWLAAGELRGNVEAVRVAKDIVCVFNATPLEKYESYRLCIERWMREPAERPDFTVSVYNLVGALTRAMSIDSYSPHNGTQPHFLVDQLPEIVVRSTAQAVRVLERKRLTPEEVAAAEEELSQGGMAYVESRNIILVTRWELSGAAEAVARFVHCACRGIPAEPADVAQQAPEDRFYSRVMEVALADFGARVLYPARPPAREADLYYLYGESRERIEEQSILSYPDYMRMIDFVIFHRDYQRNLRKYWEVPPLISEGRNFTGERFEFVTRKLGEMLGTELYEGYISGVVKKRFIRSLLFRRLEKLGIAHVAYFAAVRRIRRRAPRVG